MSGETPENLLVSQLKQRLAEQTKLAEQFDAAQPADEYKDEIELGEKYRPITELRMDTAAFLVQHTPTRIIQGWSVMTGARRLKTSIEGWVDEIHEAYPPKKSDKIS